MAPASGSPPRRTRRTAALLPDTCVYDEAATERHFEALLARAL